MKHKPLKEYTNEELIALINMNRTVEVSRLGAICAEIFRRMNLEMPLLSGGKGTKESAKNKKTTMNWISIKDKLPDKDDVYLCLIRNHYAICDFEDGEFLPNDWNGFMGTSKKSYFSGVVRDITHWMPLPEPPID